MFQLTTWPLAITALCRGTWPGDTRRGRWGRQGRGPARQSAGTPVWTAAWTRWASWHHDTRFILWGLVRPSPDPLNLCPNWLLMMWNILAEQHHLAEILLTCPLSGEGGGLWVLDTAWSCHQTDHNQGSARVPLQYVIKRAALALDCCFPEWVVTTKQIYISHEWLYCKL